jgi:hypothetical protein
VERMRRTIEEQLRSELNDALAKHNKSTWRDMFCCCFPRKQGVSCTGCLSTAIAGPATGWCSWSWSAVLLSSCMHASCRMYVACHSCSRYFAVVIITWQRLCCVVTTATANRCG